jgi:hypothetical protein
MGCEHASFPISLSVSELFMSGLCTRVVIRCMQDDRCHPTCLIVGKCTKDELIS